MDCGWELRAAVLMPVEPMDLQGFNGRTFNGRTSTSFELHGQVTSRCLPHVDRLMLDCGLILRTQSLFQIDNNDQEQDEQD